MLKRRELLRGMTIMAGGLSLSACAGPGTLRGSSVKQAGIQLYTLRDALAADVSGTITTLASIGYTEVELAGLPAGYSGQQFKTLLDDFGLRCPAMHIQGPVSEQLSIADTLGAQKLVLPVPMPLLDEQWQLRSDVSADDFLQFADTLNVMGREAKTAGLEFGYHNHAWEMHRFEDGSLAYDLMMDNTDPDLVFMEIDLGWAHVGEVDALDLFARYPGRFKTCHIKDFNAAGDIVNLGEGEVALLEQLAAFSLAGLQHYFVEHDSTKAPMDTAERAYKYLKSIDVVEFS